MLHIRDILEMKKLHFYYNAAFKQFIDLPFFLQGRLLIIQRMRTAVDV